jgi:hypothetical protein
MCGCADVTINVIASHASRVEKQSPIRKESPDVPMCECADVSR